MSTDALLGAVAARGLDGVARRPLVAEPLEPYAWSQLVAGARAHRLVGLLAAAVASEELAVTADQRRVIAEVEQAVSVHVVQLERLLLQLSTELGGAGIDTLVLKGPAFAHTVYPAPELRPFNDLDLLVRSADVDRAGQVLDGLGVARRVPELRPGFDRRFAKSTTRVNGDGQEVDLHRALAAGPLAGVLADGALFDRAVGFELAGEQLTCLDVPTAFLHACVHLVLGGRKVLLIARDIAQHLAHPGFDPGLVHDLARRWRLTAVVASALDLTRARLCLPAGWAAGLEPLVPSEEERRLLAAYPGDDEADVLALRTIRLLPGLRAKLAYAAAFAWPTAENLRARELTRGAHLRGVARRAAPDRNRRDRSR